MFAEKIHLDKYLRAIIDSSLNGISVVDSQGNLEFGNDSFFRIIGWAREKLIGQHFIKIIPEDSKEFVMSHWQAVPEDGGGLHEIKIHTQSGEIRYLNVSSSIVEIDGENKIVAIIMDITEKLRLEEKLIESEALYRDLFENANDPMYTHDLKGIISSINKVGLELLGGTEKEIIGSNISSWLVPDSYKLFEDRVSKILHNLPIEQPVIIEVIDMKGEHKWGEARTRLIRNENRITGVHGIVRDITEKMKLENQCKESEAKYRDLFENAQDIMYVVDDKMNFLKMNRIGLDMLGCTSEELIGSHLSQWITPESLRIVEERRQQRLMGRLMNKTAILEVVSKKGEHRWVEITTREIKDGEIHGIARDITENIILKRELKKSNKQQKLLSHLIQYTRGGRTRASILKQLSERSHNANQLAIVLNMDYKTIRHHLDVLIKNGIITKINDGYSDLYFISNNIEMDFNEIDNNGHK